MGIARGFDYVSSGTQNPRCAGVGVDSFGRHANSELRYHTKPNTVTTLVCLIGNLRGGADTWRSIRQHLVKGLDAHLAVLVDYNVSSSFIEENFHPNHIWRVPQVGSHSSMNFYLRAGKVAYTCLITSGAASVV